METQLNKQSPNQIAEVELVYKSNIKASKRIKLSISKYAADLLRKTWNENKIDFGEQFKVLLVNKSTSVLGILKLPVEELLTLYLIRK